MEDDKEIRRLIDYLKALRSVEKPDLAIKMLIHGVEYLLTKKDKATVQKILSQ
jgi:hypothetical protein